jgi:hypothetical protein
MMDADAERQFSDAARQAARSGTGEFTVKDAVAIYLRYGDKVTAEQAVADPQRDEHHDRLGGRLRRGHRSAEDGHRCTEGLRRHAGSGRRDRHAGRQRLAVPRERRYVGSRRNRGQNAAASSGDITFTQVPLVVYKYSSKKIALPWELIQDAAIDVVAVRGQPPGAALGRITNQHYTTGTGTAQPFGVMAAASSGKVGTTGQTLTVIYDDLVDLKHSVNRAYRKGALVHDGRQFVKVIRKIKDTAGRPIFTPGYEYGITQDTPDLLMGDPITINDDVAVMAANAKSILFGNFKQYQIRDVMERSSAASTTPPSHSTARSASAAGNARAAICSTPTR